LFFIGYNINIVKKTVYFTMEAKIISTINQKGGVGKSTITAILAVAAAVREKKSKVLILEVDPQRSIFSLSQIEDGEIVLDIGYEPKDLLKSLKTAISEYSHIFIDTQGNINNKINKQAAEIADLIIVPFGPSVLDIDPAINTVSAIRNTDSTAEVYGLLNRVRPNVKGVTECLDTVGQHCKLFDSYLSERVVYGRDISLVEDTNTENLQFRSIYNQFKRLIK
jgi:chromosome partitioning protein